MRVFEEYLLFESNKLMCFGQSQLIPIGTYRKGAPISRVPQVTMQNCLFIGISSESTSLVTIEPFIKARLEIEEEQHQFTCF